MEGLELKAYLDKNYGRCKHARCLCRDPHNPRYGGEWVGIICPDWVPTGSSNWDELRRYMFERIS